MIPVTAPTAPLGVLIRRDQVTIQRPAAVEDSHGWVTSDVGEQVGSFWGSVQWTMPRSKNSKTDSGAGPHAPAITRSAMAYLPADCGVQPGDLLTVQGHPTVAVRSVVRMPDPRPSGDLDCIQCLVEEVTTS